MGWAWASATGQRTTDATEWAFNYQTLPISSHCLAPGTALACFLLGNLARILPPFSEF